LEQLFGHSGPTNQRSISRSGSAALKRAAQFYIDGDRKVTAMCVAVIINEILELHGGAAASARGS
jgi:hypothetical protein